MLKYIGILGCIMLLTAKISEACTGITLKTKDNKQIQARTIEWGESVLKSNIIISPRNYKYQAIMPDSKNGYSWKGHYGFVGASLVDDSYIGEGVNEAGLSAGMFFFPHYGSLSKYLPEKANESITDMNLVSWMLSNFSTVDEVRENINKIRIVPVMVFADGNVSPTAHWRVSDAKGNNIVIEIVNNGEVKIYDNKVGVLTNSPDFQWHITNLNNYVHLRPGSVATYDGNGQKLFSFGMGAGALGLPGDITPPSRFVRAFFYLSSTPTPEDGYKGVTQAFQILNNFDIPIGVEYQNKKDVPKELESATQWTTAINQTDREFYYRTMYNSEIRKIDLKKIDFEKVNYQVLPMEKYKIQPYREIIVK